jgi:hypothetical protein
MTNYEMVDWIKAWALALLIIVAFFATLWAKTQKEDDDDDPIPGLVYQELVKEGIITNHHPAPWPFN